MLALSGLDGAALVVLRPHPLALAHRLDRAGPWIARQPDAAVAQLVAAALWLVAAWLGIGLLAGLLARLPGVLGRAGRRVAAVALPRVLHRLVLGSLGVGLGVGAVLTPVAASAAAAPSPASVAAVPSPVWPSSPPASTPAPQWPVSTPRAQTPSAAPRTHEPAPTHVPAPTTRAGTATGTAAGTAVRVRAGDSLWRVAADHLGPAPEPQRVTHYWQRIYAANRAVIGGNPDRIHPGQQLVLPAPTAEELP